MSAWLIKVSYCVGTTTCVYHANVIFSILSNVYKVYNSLRRVLNIFSDWSFMIGGYNDMRPSCARVRFKIWPLDWKSGIKYWFWLILSSIKQLDWENVTNPKFLGVLVKWHMSIMPQTSNPKFDRWIGRMWWDIGVREVWQQSNGWIVRNE